MEHPIHTLAFTLPDDFEHMDREQAGHLILHHFLVEGRRVLPNLTRVEAEFTGSGDSWGDSTWVFYGMVEGDGAPPEVVFQAALLEATQQALDYFVGNWVSDLYPGWENNDGGFGHVTFHLDKPACTLDFHERYSDSRHMGTTTLFNHGEDQEDVKTEEI